MTVTWFERYGLIVMLAVLTTLFAGVGYYAYVLVQSSEASNAKQTINSQLAMRVDDVQQHFEYGRSQVRFLANTPPNRGIIRALDNQGFDEQDKTSLSQWRDRLATIFRSYIQEHGDVLQIRYILADKNYSELVRVELVDDEIVRTPQSQLQAKGGRDYISHSMQLQSQQTYISDINLNHEFGRVQEPYQPTYRITQLIHDEQGQPRAILVVNYDANVLINSIAQGLAQGLELIGIGAQQQFFAHPDTRWLFANEFNATFVPAQQQFVRTNKQELGMPVYLDKLSAQHVYAQQQSITVGSPQTPIVLSLALYLSKESLAMAIDRRWQVWLGVLIILYVILLLSALTYHHFVIRQLTLSRTIREYHTIFQRTAMPVLLLNSEGAVCSANPAAEQLFNSVNGSENQHFATLLGFEERQCKQIQAAIDKREHLDMELGISKADGEERQVNVSVLPVYEQKQPTSSAVAALLLYDHTTEFNLRRQLQSMNASLETKVAERTEQLEATRKEAEQANEAKSLFVANMSHELRTPMNGVFGMLNLIKKEPLSEQQNHYLQLAQASATNLTGLINSVLDISKIEAGKMELEVQSVNLEVVLSELLQSNSIRPKEKGLLLLLDSSGLTQPTFLGDVTRIRQIFTNLLGNAIKFTDNGHVLIKVQSRLQEGQYRIDFVVEDSGVGIEPSKLKDLFNSFTQADNSITRKYGGTGLGLAITKQLVQLMGGEIRVESELGKGSRFIGHIMLSSAENRAVMAEPLAGSRAVIIDEVAIRKQVITNHLRQWGAEVIDADWHDVDELAASGDFHQLLLFVDATKQGREVQAHLHTLLHAQHSEKLKVIVNCSQYQMNTAFAEQYDNVECLLPPISAVVLAHILFSAEGAEQPLCDSPPVTALDFHSVSGAKVLVVDDNAINQVVVTGVFKDLPITLVSCGDGKQALDILNADPHFDVILMDCQMPVMDGYSASLAIRRGDAGEHYTGIAIIAMTANAMAGDRERCLQAGMSDYITKPVDADQLLEKVYYWLSVANVKKRTQIDVKSEK
ncbi:hybrid sensor histidine kinase/response regulator [Pseudoalteromonas ruthenica]|uniref:histidine kinase n=1 Tax=Pseudoalteromonas ruthenica TaxID=151081 RepID=A0A0F4PSV5_9GAMM|nr:hypothetical protein TW76_11510 [Pseudoalteromonas ruthenica]KJY98550.1 hypothetical protein TW72_12525 [Pseudoalteromonas ruthenica]TMO90050.1 hybrid sensor histidine kinase/response regulator [Pseudoalteromonas ruthenica]TMO91274.1 hybrid sensor histidine kinase/response regulator [Pseudoalteromonas ruthenica]TMO97961.1 hybrid sensor histidine kinase/response regulator [Pseudoalteromonas ruthenica]